MLLNLIQSILQMRNLYVVKTVENNFIKYDVYKNKLEKQEKQEKIASAITIISIIHDYYSYYDFVKINYKDIFINFERIYTLSVDWVGIEYEYINEYKGLGTLLMMYLLNDINEYYPKVQLSTLDNMANDLSFYEKIGYLWITGKRNDGPEMIGNINDIIKNKSILCKIENIKNFWKIK
jgi:hypothetical protein